jgi:uncharacterized protein YjbI with pentapeptide repeats
MMDEQFLAELLQKYNTTLVDERSQSKLNAEELKGLLELAERGDIEVNPYGQVDISGFKLDDANLSSIDMRNFVLTNCTFFNAKLSRDNLIHLANIAREEGLDLKGINLEGEKLDKYNLQDDTLGLGSNVIEMPYNLSYLNLPQANFRGIYGKGTIFSGSNLEGADFSDSNLSNAKFDGAKIAGVSLIGAKFNPRQFEHSEGREEVILEGEKSLEEMLEKVSEVKKGKASLFSRLKSYLNHKKISLVALFNKKHLEELAVKPEAATKAVSEERSSKIKTAINEKIESSATRKIQEKRAASKKEKGFTH